MSNEKLTFTIGGREALPVRAIPYVARWKIASPEWIADYLAMGAGVPRGAIPLSAYQLINDAPVAVMPSEWDLPVAKLKGLVHALHEQRPGLDPMDDHAGYAAYQARAIDALPHSVFVWLDEFESAYQTHCERNHYGNDTLTLAPMATNDETTRARVLKGFEWAATVPTAAQKVGATARDDGYTSLCKLLDGYWEKPWSQLPKEQRQAWHEALGAIGDEDGKLWGGHNVQWRKGVAESHDYAQDPANAPEIKAGIRLGYWSVVARDFGAPDWKYWLDLPSWTPREAACLIFVLNPDRYEQVASNLYPQPRGLIEEIVSVERKAVREQQAGRLCERPSPDEWAEWAHANGYALPKNLRGYCTSSSTDDSEAKDALWNYVTLVRGKEREIADWEEMNHRGIPSEAKTRDDTLTRLRAELEVLKQTPPGTVSAEKLAVGSKDDAVKDGAGKTAVSTLPEGIPTGKIAEKFRLSEAWKSKLTHLKVNPFLKDALMRQGCRHEGNKRRMSHLWNPVRFAEILIERDGRNRRAMEAVITHHFADWQDVWNESMESDETDEYAA